MIPIFPVEFMNGENNKSVIFEIDTNTTRNFAASVGTFEQMTMDPPLDSFVVFFLGGAVLTLLAVALYAIKLRLIFYLYYTIYLCDIILGTMAVSGRLDKFIPEGYFNTLLSLTFSLWFGLTIETIRLFRPNLHYPKAFVNIRKLTWSVTGVCILIGLTGEYGLVSKIIQILFPFFLITISILAVACYNRGEATGRICCWAYGCECVCSSIFALYNLGLLPNFFFVQYLYILNTYVHMVVINVAIIFWIEGLRKESTIATRSLINHLRSSEKILEATVAERTEKLEAEINHRRRAEQDLQKAHLKVVSALAGEKHAQSSLRDLFLTITHDLKTPLMVLRNHFESSKTSRDLMLSALIALEESVTTGLDKIAKQSNKSLNETSYFDVVPAITNIIKRAETTTDLKIEFMKNCDSLLVKGQMQMLEMAITNLINNSITHALGARAITIILRDNVTTFSIVVQDDGCGVKEGHLDLLFNRGWKHSNTSKRSTGLGLYLVKKIVENHAGTTFAGLVKPNGLRIEISIPK